MPVEEVKLPAQYKILPSNFLDTAGMDQNSAGKSFTLSQKKMYDWLNSNSSRLYFLQKGILSMFRLAKIQHLPEHF